MDKGKGRQVTQAPISQHQARQQVVPAPNPDLRSFIRTNGKGPSVQIRGLQDRPAFVENTSNAPAEQRFRTQREQVEADGFEDFALGRDSTRYVEGTSRLNGETDVTQWLDQPHQETFDHIERATMVDTSSKVPGHSDSMTSVFNVKEFLSMQDDTPQKPGQDLAALFESSSSPLDILEYLDQGTYTEDIWGLTESQRASLRRSLGDREVALHRLELLKAHFKARI